jgi:Cu-Zn family superoxide dismutase
MMKFDALKKGLPGVVATILVLVVGIGAGVQAKEHEPASITHATARIFPTENGHCSGVVTFQEENGKVHVTATIKGLAPNSKHGFHIHEYGDLSKLDGTSAGGHYNPEGHPHALPPKLPRHAGDMGNLVADSQGTAHYDATFSDISIAGMMNPILGRGVIVHAKADDGGQPTGNAGARIGMGVIGIASQ